MNNELKKEFKFILLILILNLNSKLNYLSIVILFLYGIRNNENALKSIIYSFSISQLNPTIFSSGVGSLRTILNIFFIIKIIIDKRALYELKKNIVSIILIIYATYITITALLVSWLPLVSIFKGIYFTMGFLAIYIGIKINKHENWIAWIRNYFIVFLTLNVAVMILPQGYSTNGVAFNGLTANPNGLGITLVMGLAIFLYSNKFYKKNIIIIVLSTLLIFITNSRTSIITTITVLIYYIFLEFIFIYKEKKEFIFKKLAYIFFSIAILIAFSPIYLKPVNNLISEKLMKGQEEGDALKSREGQIETFFYDFNKNRLIGVGFGVDGKDDLVEQDFSFKLSYPVERGNIILAVLAETGYLGFFIFSSLILSLIIYSFKNNYKIENFFYGNIFLISSLMISLGEMTFFSGNSLGVVQWLFLSIYAMERREVKK